MIHLFLVFLFGTSSAAGRGTTLVDSNHPEHRRERIIAGPASGIHVTSTPQKNCLALRESNRLTRGGHKTRVGNYKLDAAAVQQCRNMASAGITQHFTAHTMPSDRVRSAGYSFLRLAENIASEPDYYGGESDPIRAVHYWWNSHDHRMNMLGAYDAVGYASCQGKWDQKVDFLS